MSLVSGLTVYYREQTKTAQKHNQLITDIT